MLTNDRLRDEAGEIDMRVYVGAIAQPMHDIRAGFDHLHDSDVGTYSATQAFARDARAANAWGIVYRSVRRPGGECIAALRPPAVSIPSQGPHLSYVWDGASIVRVYQKTRIM